MIVKLDRAIELKIKSGFVLSKTRIEKRVDVDYYFIGIHDERFTICVTTQKYNSDIVLFETEEEARNFQLKEIKESRDPLFNQSMKDFNVVYYEIKYFDAIEDVQENTVVDEQKQKEEDYLKFYFS